MEATVVDGNGTEAGHIIVTTIGGRNGQPKQVMCHSMFYHFWFKFMCILYPGNNTLYFPNFGNASKRFMITIIHAFKDFRQLFSIDKSLILGNYLDNPIRRVSTHENPLLGVLS